MFERRQSWWFSGEPSTEVLHECSHLPGHLCNKQLLAVLDYGTMAHGRFLAMVGLCLVAQSYRRLQNDRFS